MSIINEPSRWRQFVKVLLFIPHELVRSKIKDVASPIHVLTKSCVSARIIRKTLRSCDKGIKPILLLSNHKKNVHAVMEANRYQIIWQSLYFLFMMSTSASWYCAVIKGNTHLPICRFYVISSKLLVMLLSR
jgi:hypothetical protein